MMSASTSARLVLQKKGSGAAPARLDRRADPVKGFLKQSWMDEASCFEYHENVPNYIVCE
jgi:hypothetical protein